MKQINKNILYNNGIFYTKKSYFILLLKCFLYKNHCYYSFLDIIKIDIKNNNKIKINNLSEIIDYVCNKNIFFYIDNTERYIFTDGIIDNMFYFFNDSKDSIDYWINLLHNFKISLNT